MTMMQKINIAALVSGLAAFGWYLARVIPSFIEVGADAAWKWPMATSLIGFVVLLVVASIAIAVRDEGIRDGKADTEDERDRRAERRGETWAAHVVQASVFLALALMFLDQPTFWIANTLYVGVMLGGAAGLLIGLMGGQADG